MDGQTGQNGRSVIRTVVGESVPDNGRALILLQCLAAMNALETMKNGQGVMTTNVRVSLSLYCNGALWRTHNHRAQNLY